MSEKPSRVSQLRTAEQRKAEAVKARAALLAAAEGIADTIERLLTED